MSVTSPTPPSSAPMLAVTNIVNGLASTLIGVATAAPVIAQSVASVSFPTTLAGWLQAILGTLAIFAKG